MSLRPLALKIPPPVQDDEDDAVAAAAREYGGVNSTSGPSNDAMDGQLPPFSSSSSSSSAAAAAAASASASAAASKRRSRRYSCSSTSSRSSRSSRGDGRGGSDAISEFDDVEDNARDGGRRRRVSESVLADKERRRERSKDRDRDDDRDRDRDRTSSKERRRDRRHSYHSHSRKDRDKDKDKDRGERRPSSRDGKHKKKSKKTDKHKSKQKVKHKSKHKSSGKSKRKSVGRKVRRSVKYDRNAPSPADLRLDAVQWSAERFLAAYRLSRECLAPTDFTREMCECLCNDPVLAPVLFRAAKRLPPGSHQFSQDTRRVVSLVDSLESARDEVRRLAAETLLFVALGCPELRDLNAPVQMAGKNSSEPGYMPVVVNEAAAVANCRAIYVRAGVGERQLSWVSPQRPLPR